MIQQSIRTPGLNTVIVYSRTAIVRAQDGCLIKRRGREELDYCIRQVEENRGHSYAMSPHIRDKDMSAEPYV
jgi:hypothetical protein